MIFTSNQGTRGVISDLIARVLANPEDADMLAAIREESADLCRKFPLYPERWDETD